MLLEPSVKFANENILGAKCLVKINKGKAVLRLINPNDSDIYLKGNKVLAIVSQVEKENIFSLKEVENETTNLNHSNHKPNFDLSDADLDEQQKQELLQFLERNNDLFSSGLHDLGKNKFTNTHHRYWRCPSSQNAFL